MKNSPFAFFRKHQRVGMVLLTVMAMFAFVFLDQTMRGVGGSHASQIAVKIKGGNLTHEQLGQLINQRVAANRFIQAAAEAVMEDFPKDQEAQMAARAMFQQQFGQDFPGQPDSDTNVMWSHIMRLEAKRMGMIVTDHTVESYISRLLRRMVSADRYQEILKRIKLSEKHLYDVFREEILSKMAATALFPRVTQTPEQYWEFYKRLKVQQNLELAALPVKEFASSVAKPSDRQLESLFNEYKSRYAGNGPDYWKPGFRQPTRVRVQYLTTSQLAIEKKVEDGTDPYTKPVTDKDVLEFYEKNKDRLYTELEIDDPLDSETKDGAQKKADNPLDPLIAPEKSSPEKSSKTEPTKPGAEKPDPEKPATETEAKEAPAEKPATKPAEPAAEKAATEKAAEPKTEQPADKAEVPAESKPADKSEDQPEATKPEETKPEEKRPEENTEKKPCGEDPVKGDEPAVEKPVEAQSTETKASEDKPEDAKPTAEKPEAEKAADEKPAATEKPAAEEKPATEKPAEEKPATEKPAEEKPSEEKPAAKPAADSPKTEDGKPAEGTDQPGQTKPDDAKPGDAKPEGTKPVVKPPKYKPLTDDLKSDIRDQLVNDRVLESMKKLGEAAKNQLEEDQLKYAYGPSIVGKTVYIDFNENAELDEGEPSIESEEKLDQTDVGKIPHALIEELNLKIFDLTKAEMTKVGKKLGLEYRETDLISIQDLEDKDNVSLGRLSKVVDINDNPFQPNNAGKIIQELYGSESRFHVNVGKDDEDRLYVYWKVEHVKEHIAKFTDKGIKEEVLAAWNLLNAYPAAQKRAEELVEEAKKKKDLRQAFEGQTVTGDKQGLPLDVHETGDFSWMSTGIPSPQMMQASQVTLSHVEWTDDKVDDEFMRAACEDLEVGEVGFAPNRDHTVIFVIRVVNRGAKNGDDMVKLRETFMKEQLFDSFPAGLDPSLRQYFPPPAYAQMAMQENSRVYFEWLESLKEKYQITWTDEMRNY